MANKKINQLVSKTAILSTDIFGIGDATTGQLFKKTIAELQAAIGGAVISVNGLVGTVVLDTDDIQELATPTNKYFTDARARGAISLTVTGSSGASTYSNGTGVLNVPTYTLAGLGGISATFLSGTSGISYNSTTGVISYSGTVYTDASIRALLSGSTGISYNSTTGAISYSGTVYTDSSVRALISLTTTGTSGASTYNNTTGVINVPNYTLAGLGGISLTSLSGGTGITYNNTTGAISYSGTVYTDASIRGLISLTTTGTSGASTYNSTTGVLNIPQYTTDLSGYLPLTGGTLTGALGGTSATFTGNVSINSTNSKTGGTAWNLNIRDNTALAANVGGGISFQGVYTTGGSIGNFGAISSYKTNATSGNESGGLRLYYSANGIITQGLQISETGAATFSSSVTATQGIFNNAGQLLSFQRSGTERWKVENNSSNDLLISGLTSGGTYYIFQNSVETFSLNTTRAFFGTNVGIGTSSPSDKLQVTTSSGNGIKITTDDVTTLKMTTSSGGVKNWGFATTNTAASDFGIYQSTSNGGDPISAGTAKLYFAAGGTIAIGYSGDAGYKLYVSGTIYATGNITANSDLTLKKNLTIIDNPVDKLMQLNGYSYQWKSDDSHQYGVIAQEVEKILPYAVSTGNDGIKGVSYNQIIPVLIEAVKEQKTKIENLEILLASK
jgi:hypothetical protein